MKKAKNKKLLKKKKVVKETRLNYEKLKQKFDQKVSEVDVQHSKFKTIERAKKKVYNERVYLRKLLSKAVTKREKALIRKRINKTSRFLTSIKKRKGTHKPLKGFEKQVQVLEKKVVLRNIYKWEASDVTDDILNQGLIKRFVVSGVEYKRAQASRILIAVDDLETEADFRGIYYLKFLVDLGEKTLTITIGD